MTSIGLIIIIVAWAFQLRGKAKVLKKEFVIIYAIGVLLLAIDGFSSGLYELAILNLASFSAALLVFLRLKSK